VGRGRERRRGDRDLDLVGLRTLCQRRRRRRRRREMNRFNTTIGALLRTARTPSRRAWLGHPSSYSTHTAPTPPTACLSCHHALPSSSLTPLCPHCSTLLPPPPSSTSHFSLFSLSPTYTLDQKALKDQYRAYQQKVHPDLYLGKGQMEGWAREWSGRVNEAFRCLEGPRSRGEYLVSLYSIIFRSCLAPASSVGQGGEGRG
jgi:hypothetical protein